ncbi:MAG: hypothetical protein B6D55_04875 [Candidatus Omnitrophica bacterium 4484_70.2]|nr:MAG: hypothetical protein B6D55_04875 [Candidatus Omnitrophica bacterium 4484_70.2]
MHYHKITDSRKNPFFNSYNFFYFPSIYKIIFRYLIINIKKRKGINLILGDKGVGKTSFLYALSYILKKDKKIITQIISHYFSKSEYQFLLYLSKKLNIIPYFRSTLDLKESVRNYLLEKEEKGKIVVFLIDEGEKVSLRNLEVLREFVEYKNNNKLLQLVIASRTELLHRTKMVRTLLNRVEFKYILTPLDDRETKKMIEFRLKKAGVKNISIFTSQAFELIYQYTQGYPLRVLSLCQYAWKIMKDEGRCIIDNKIIEKARGKVK